MCLVGYDVYRSCIFHGLAILSSQKQNGYMTSRSRQDASLHHTFDGSGSTAMSRRSETQQDASPDEEHSRALALLDLSISLIDQALDILHRHLKEDRQLTHASKLMPGGSVGKHFRHVCLSSPAAPRLLQR